MRRSIVIAMVVWAYSAPLHAAVFRSGETVVVSSDERIEDDLYASGGNVRIDGVIEGDLVVAGGNVIVTGEVEGDLLAAGGTVHVLGKVRDAARVAAGNVRIEGRSGGDTMAFGGDVTLDEGARVGGDLVVAGAGVRVAGTVGDDVIGAGQRVTLAGKVEGDGDLAVSELRVDAGGSVAGTLAYRSPAPARIDPSARIGEVVYAKSRESAFAGATGPIATFLMALVFGLVLIALFPRHARTVAEQLRRPWNELGWGAILIVAVPLLLVLLAITVIGIPLALAGLALFAVALYVAHLATGLAIGRWLRERMRRPIDGPRDLAWALVLGLAVLVGLELIPFAGGLVTLAALLAGLGAIFVGERQHWRSRPV